MRELLLCPPDYYGIEYEINPWMSRARAAESELAKSQWEGLRQTLASLDSKIELVPPQPKLPDMVFTANAGLTVGKKFIPSNFRYPERAGEAPYFRRWMEEHGYETIWLPDNLYFEGEGDALFSNDTLFCGYKFRSDIQSHRAVGELLRCLVISVELVDPRFYHLDTCFCPSAGWERILVSKCLRRVRSTRNSRACERAHRRGGRRSQTFLLQRRRSGA